MPVENYSVVQQSENGTQFGPNSKIRFRVGSHLGYVDFHTSYLQFNLEVMQAKAKMEFTNEMGADVLIRTWRVLIGGHIIEEIDHPNTLLKVIKYDYGQDLGMSEICEVLDKAGRGTGYQGLNKPETVDVRTVSPCAVVKCILDLNFSGIFGSTQTFPVGMTGDVEIEMTLEDPRKCLQVVRSAVLPRCLTTNGHLCNGVRAADIVADSGAATTNIIFKDQEVAASEFPILATVNSAQANADNLSNMADQPFSIGQSLILTGEGGAAGATDAFSSAATAITNAVSDNGGKTQVVASFPQVITNNAVDLRLALNPAGLDAATAGAAAVHWDNGGLLTYEVSVPQLVLQVVVPPEQYVQEQARKVATEGFSIDVPTYTCYKNNTYAGVNSATLEVPCYSSRARSILAIGVDGDQALGGNNVLTNPYSFNGFYNDLDTYQFQIGEDRQPVRPVNCSNLSTYQHNVAQEQLTELEKALRSAGCNVRSVRKHHDNFVIGRALSSYGGSIPLTMKGARIYLDYLSSDKRLQSAVVVKNKQFFTYVCHIRRLNITQSGVSVMY